MTIICRTASLAVFIFLAAVAPAAAQPATQNLALPGLHQHGPVPFATPLRGVAQPGMTN